MGAPENVLRHVHRQSRVHHRGSEVAGEPVTERPETAVFLKVDAVTNAHNAVLPCQSKRKTEDMINIAETNTPEVSGQPTEEEMDRAWEIRNKIAGQLEDGDIKCDIDDNRLRLYIWASECLRVKLWQISNISVAVNQCRRNREPNDIFGDERNPFALTGLWRLAFVNWIDLMIDADFRADHDKPEKRSFEAFTQHVAKNADICFQDWEGTNSGKGNANIISTIIPILPGAISEPSGLASLIPILSYCRVTGPATSACFFSSPPGRPTNQRLSLIY